MAGFGRRRAVEGWELKVSDPESDDGPMSLAQRMARNNKLWVISLIVVILGTMLVVKLQQRASSQAASVANEPPPIGTGVYDDSAHRDFARTVADSKAYGWEVLDARFTGPGSFRIVVPGDVSWDDIEHMSHMTARKILHDFRCRVVVQTYMRNADKSQVLTSVTMWNAEKHGFITKKISE